MTDLTGSSHLATIRDVARTAGVSIATVSRVFNDNKLVSPETAERVLKVAKSLDYWPNSAAQSLSTRCNHTLGVLLPDLFGEFYSEVIRGIDRQARLNDYQTLLSSSHASSQDVLNASRAMLGRIDGLIMMAPDEATIDIVERIRRRVPVVLLNPRGVVERCHRVSVQNYEGARAAVEHLLSLGHREIALISGPEDNVDAEERLRGFRDALADAGLDPDRSLIVPGDFSEMSGFEAGLSILQHQPRPTAAFACNDSMAVGLVSAVGRAGSKVPEDLAVVGFDNITIAEYLNPPLTTVHVDACNLGQHAVDLMLSAIEAEGDVPAVVEMMPAVLKIRRSCGAYLSQEESPGSGTGNAARFGQ